MAERKVIREMKVLYNDEFNGIIKERVSDFTDPETRIHYLIYNSYYRDSGMGGITPRLNPDGSFMVEKPTWLPMQ